MACGDVLSLEDLQTAKKHQIFEAEVVTGKAGGVAGGVDIDYATNQVTGQVQKTMPAIMRDLGFEPASFDFTSGGTLGVDDRNKAVLWPLSSGGDGNWYYWGGVLPKVIPAYSTPASTGGVVDGAWRPVGDITLRGDLASSLGSSLVGFLQTGTGPSPRTSQDKMRELVSVRDFGAVGDGIADDTTAIQTALNTGKSLYFPAGVYLTDPLTIPFSARGAVYHGDGSFHYDAHHQTVIKARTDGQSHILIVGGSGPNGADCLSFEHIRFDCDGKAEKGIDATFGAFFTMTNCCVYNYTSYGVYHKQGLARYSRAFMYTSPVTYPNAVGLHLYSDSSVTDSEFVGGGTPLKLVAGGNRLVNVWANTGAVSCITLTPFDDTTTHINTSMTNVYAGEIVMSSPSGVRPIIEITGTAAQRVQEVQFSNSYLVTAAAIEAYKKVGGIYLDYCDAIAISNIVIRGNGLDATANRYCDYFVKAQRSKTIAITGCTIKGVNKNPISLVSDIDNPVVVSGCAFYNWAVDAGVVGAEAAAIRIRPGTSAIVTGCMFHCDTGSAVPYAVNAPTAADINFTGNRVSFANPAAITLVSGTPAAIYESSGQKQITGHIISNTSVNNAKQNYLERGQVTARANSTTNLVTLVNDAENKTYLLSIRQSGSGVNSVIGFVSANSGSCKAYRISQDNTGGGALDMNITNSGLTLQLVLGSGYGYTTWDWVLTRLG